MRRIAKGEGLWGKFSSPWAARLMPVGLCQGFALRSSPAGTLRALLILPSLRSAAASAPGGAARFACRLKGDRSTNPRRMAPQGLPTRSTGQPPALAGGPAGLLGPVGPRPRGWPVDRMERQVSASPRRRRREDKALRASRWAGGFSVPSGRRRGRLDRSLRSLHRVTPGGSRSGIKPRPAVAIYSVRLTAPPVMPRCTAGLPRVAYRPAVTLSRKPPAPPAAVRRERQKSGGGKASRAPAASQAGFATDLGGSTC